MVETYIKTGTVQFVYVPYISLRDGSDLAARASLCALEQGSFWELHDALFERLAPNRFTETGVINEAVALGLDEFAFTACLYSDSVQARLNAAAEFINIQRDANAFSGTPTLIVDGQNPFRPGFVPSWSEIQQAIDQAAAD